MFSFQNKKVLLLRSMFVRTPAIRPNAAAEIHLFTASVADGWELGKGKSDITHTSCISKFYPTFRV